MSAALIFGLLFALMLTGMPISISLGLTVLTYLFAMTTVPFERTVRAGARPRPRQLAIVGSCSVTSTTIVEDTPINQAVAAHMVERAGHARHQQLTR